MASSEEMAQEYYEKGMQRLFSHSLIDSLDNLKMAESIFEELNNSEMYLRTIGNISVVYSMLGYISPMLNYIMKGLIYCDNHSIKGGKYIFYNTMCDKYMSLKDYDNAVNYGLLAVHDIESNYDDLLVIPSSILPVYLNIALCYIKTFRTTEAKLYLFKAKTYAEKNDLTDHNLSLMVLEAYLEYSVGNSDYLIKNLDTLMNLVKNFNLTLENYVQDIRLLVELLCKMEKYEQAIDVTQVLEYSAKANNNAKLSLDTAKIVMYIYKQSGDVENYHNACVTYAETETKLREKEISTELQNMDTAIALTIAATPASLI